MILIGGTREISLEDIQGSVFEMLRAFNVRAPEYEKLHKAYYGALTMSPAQVKEFRAETEALRSRYLAKRKQDVQKEKRVHAQDPVVLDEILVRLLADDAWLAKLNEILSLCDEAITRGGTILCVGD